MCCGYALNGMHLAQPTVMHCSTLLHHVECTWGALGARVRPTPILNPATSVNPAPIKNDGHPSRDDGNAQCDGGRQCTNGAGPLDLMGADPSVR